MYHSLLLLIAKLRHEITYQATLLYIFSFRFQDDAKLIPHTFVILLISRFLYFIYYTMHNIDWQV